ncbi:MAG TPA: ThiF family adenylyltransferase [Terriglobales bacterium]|nr:ThiF family adenylyltransferase [Terriglobales bacterium]
MRLEFALTEEQHADMLERLFGERAYRRKDPERGFLAAVFPATGAERRTLLLGQIVEPGEEDVYWSPGEGLVMTHRYYSRALSVIQSVRGAGLLNVHSHPGPRTGIHPPSPSLPDLQADARELCFVSRALPEGRPTTAAIVTPAGAMSVREYAFLRPRTSKEALSVKFGPNGAKVAFAERIRIVGPGLRVLPGNPTKKLSVLAVDGKVTESSILLWGERGQKILSGLCIGIAGLGGMGGILAEHLARLGVGTLVLVDYDRLEEANFNRSQGATRSDVASRAAKVEIYARIARESATAPDFRVFARRASVCEDDGLKALLDCDIIVGAADDAFARQVLDHAAYAHLIPVVDGGTALVPDAISSLLVAGKSQAAAAGPAHPCLECQGVYTQEEATVARESTSWGNYINLPGNAGKEIKKELRAPAVICNNGLVASLIGLRVLAIALGITPKTLRGTQRFYVEEGKLAWAATKVCKPDCPKPSRTGLGDSHYIPIGTDLRWQQLRKAEAATQTHRKSNRRGILGNSW